jgi:NAD(P)-dependent dehydrogenase (short-subunit alcohol dehydrogenase family)
VSGPPEDAEVVLVTGANQGLGFALVESLSTSLPPGSVLYLTGRNPTAVAAAAGSLAGNPVPPTAAYLDVTDPDSIAAVAEEIEKLYGGVTAVISNAAARISPTRTQAEQVDMFVDTNNHGTTRMLAAFGPLLRDGARVVVVASAFGSLRNLRPELRSRFDVDTADLADIDAAVDDYAELVRSGRDAAAGWPEWMNVASKVAQVATMKVFARQHEEEFRERDIVVNACCPGLIDTDASRPWFPDMSTALTPAAASPDVSWLATLPAGTREPYGELLQYRKVIPWL